MSAQLHPELRVHAFSDAELLALVVISGSSGAHSHGKLAEGGGRGGEESRREEEEEEKEKELLDTSVENLELLMRGVGPKSKVWPTEEKSEHGQVRAGTKNRKERKKQGKQL